MTEVFNQGDLFDDVKDAFILDASKTKEQQNNRQISELKRQVEELQKSRDSYRMLFRKEQHRRINEVLDLQADIVMMRMREEGQVFTQTAKA